MTQNIRGLTVRNLVRIFPGVQEPACVIFIKNESEREM